MRKSKKVIRPGDVLLANYAKAKKKYDDIGMKDKDVDRIKPSKNNNQRRTAPTRVSGLKRLGDIPNLIRSGIGSRFSKNLLFKYKNK
tara:strand:+ start:318 stop:578 length:261 start_codon:yes stop_codon:yes gene_type:complete